MSLYVRKSNGDMIKVIYLIKKSKLKVHEYGLNVLSNKLEKYQEDLKEGATRD